MLNDGDNAILNLADILFGAQANQDVMTKALSVLCSYAAYPDGGIYGMDHTAHFSAMKCYTTSVSLSAARFCIREFTSQERRELAQKAVLQIQRSPQNTPLETKLLDIYAVESLILAPIADEKGHIYGFVVLLSTAGSPTLNEQSMRELSLMLTMMVRYISVEIYQKKLNRVKSSFESILNNTGIDIYVKDFHTHEVLYVNESMAAPYGGAEQFRKQKCWQVLFPGQSEPCSFCPQNKLVDEHGNPTKTHSWDYQRPFDGLWFRVFSSAFKWEDGRLAHVVSSADITENKRNEALIENLANFDQLTKLPNRRMLLKECSRRIDNATSTEQGYVLFLDIDGFKAVNDTLGHDAGDDLLIQLGVFFSGIPLFKNSIFRNGGDEFVAILGGEMMSKDNIQNLANFILARFKKPWHLKKGTVFCNTSIGIACYPEDGATADQLLQVADIAMYRVKKSGGAGFCFGYQINEDLS